MAAKNADFIDKLVDIVEKVTSTLTKVVDNQEELIRLTSDETVPILNDVSADLNNSSKEIHNVSGNIEDLKAILKTATAQQVLIGKVLHNDNYTIAEIIQIITSVKKFLVFIKVLVYIISVLAAGGAVYGLVKIGMSVATK